MRVVLFGFGSRGDVQPFVALGVGLKAAGYQVAIAAGKNFRPLVEGAGLEFEPVRMDIEQFMQNDFAKDWLDASSHNPMAELRNMKRMVEAAAEDVADDLLDLAQRTDVFISGILTLEPIASICKIYGKRLILGLMSPFPPSAEGYAGMQAPLPRRKSVLNLWFGYMVEVMLLQVFRKSSNVVRQRLHLPKVNLSDFMRVWNRTPALVGISPHIVPKPQDWGTHVHVGGYWFLSAPEAYQAPPSLEAFLQAGAPPVYIGFGSMSTHDPQGVLKTMLSALEQSGQRGVILRGWAGLHQEDLPETVYLSEAVPHDWLFPRMSAVIHHGGAGTTAAGARAGVPSAVVAHIGDQWYWGRRLHELGVGAPPLRRHQLNSASLSQMIHQLTRSALMRQKAADLGKSIRVEDGVAQAVRSFEQILAQP